MVEADLLRMVMLFTIPLSVALGLDTNLALVLAVAFLVGIGHALFEASAQAFLTDLVPRGEIVRSNARLSLTEGLAEVGGPLLAGGLIAALGATGAVTVDAATFALSALALIAVHRVTETVAPRSQAMRAAIGEGLRTLVRQPQLKALTVLQAAGNLCSGIVAGLAILFLQRTLGLSGWQAGIVYAANGLGGVAASLVCPRLTGRFGIGRTVLLGVLGAAVGFALLSVSTTATWAFLATGGMALVGVGVVTSIIASASLRQHLVPSAFLGRVTTSYRTVVNGAVALGALLGGVIGEIVGVRPALLVGSAAYLAVSAVGFATPLNRPDADIVASP